MTATSRPPLLARMGAAVGACVLVSLGAAYYLTYEPAPQVSILWRAGISSGRRPELERRFLLVNPVSDRDRVAYDLLDTRRENLEALVHERDVADTDRVSRELFELPFDVPYGESWMWVAHRTPLLRTPGVVPGIIVTCVVLLTAGLVAEGRWRRNRSRH